MSTRGKKGALTPVSRGVSSDLTSIDQLSGELRSFYMLLSSKFDESLRQLEEKIDKKDEKISKIESDVLILRKENLALQQRLEDIECRERGDSVILSGPDVPAGTPHENVSNTACNVVKQTLKCELSPDSVVEAYRVGGKSMSQASDRRNVLIKLRSKDLRRDILMSAKKMKSNGLYVNENLTPARAKILYCLRQVRRACPGGVNSCGSLNGRIYAYVKPTHLAGKDQRVFMNTMPELEEFIEKHLGKKLHYLIDVNQTRVNSNA